MTDLHWMRATEAARAIAARELSPVELMDALLERIGRLDPKLNVFIRLDGDAAMDAARAAEAEIMAGRRRGPVWEFADRVQITPTRSRRSVKNWLPDPVSH